MALSYAQAQDISRYEYWTDDNYAGRSVVSATAGEISFDVSTELLDPGVHFLNFRAEGSNGEWGHFYRYMFYVPMPIESEQTPPERMVYWFDDEYAARAYFNIGEDLAPISIENLSCGIHYFNCRTVDKDGNYGNLMRDMFFIPGQKEAEGNAIANSEFWLDDDYDNRTILTQAEEELALDIDVNKLSRGIHFFNYRAQDDKGCWGNPIRKMFYMAKMETEPEKEVLEYEYWFDDDTDNKVSGIQATAYYLFDIDLAGIAAGNHKFNFRAKNLLEQWGETFVESFRLLDKGDADADTEIDRYDIEAIIKHIMGNTPTKFNMITADANSDGVINAADIVYIINLLNPIESSDSE